MGFRTVFVSEDVDVKWPQWFYEKWQEHINFTLDRCNLISSRYEAKLYDTWETLPADIQRAVNWNRLPRFRLVFMFECGCISKCEITKDKIEWTEPADETTVSKPDHDFCLKYMF